MVASANRIQQGGLTQAYRAYQASLREPDDVYAQRHKRLA